MYIPIGKETPKAMILEYRTWTHSWEEHSTYDSVAKALRYTKMLSPNSRYKVVKLTVIRNHYAEDHSCDGVI